MTALWVLALQLLLSPIPLHGVDNWFNQHVRPVALAAYERATYRLFDEGDGLSHRINSNIGYGVVRERSDSSFLPSAPEIRDTSGPGSARVVGLGGGAIPGSRVTIIDGDTIALPCAVPASGCAEKIRLQGIDTPETFRPSCEAEREAGLRAKERLAELIREREITVSRGGEDRYGRTLGDVHAGGVDVGSILVSEGLALLYEPGPKAKASRIAHWCGPGDW